MWWIPPREMSTRCRTPAAAAAASSVRVAATSPLPRRPVARCRTVSAPATASRMPAPVSRSPVVRSGPLPLLSARTSCPATRKRATVGTPSVPVAPVTNVVVMGVLCKADVSIEVVCAEARWLPDGTGGGGSGGGRGAPGLVCCGSFRAGAAERVEVRQELVQLVDEHVGLRGRVLVDEVAGRGQIGRLEQGETGLLGGERAADGQAAVVDPGAHERQVLVHPRALLERRSAGEPGRSGMDAGDDVHD